MINVTYFHVVFTLPSDLNTIIYQNQEVLYSLFFKCVSETLKELAYDKKYLGAQIGITSVLHTWGQTLSYHPHIHYDKQVIMTSETKFPVNTTTSL